MWVPNPLFLFAFAFLFANTFARRIDWKINLAGNAVDGFAAEEEYLQLGEEAVKTRYHGHIKGTGNDLKVFQTQRFSREEDLLIHVPVPDGIYSVTLMFAETWDKAFQPGVRVFDVYLGSKPGGVIRVADSFDAYKSGGPAAPVRRNFKTIATQDGLTIALRPIKQNPQIAGIVVTGFSYSESLMDELPTIPGNGSPPEDFSVLSTIGPRLLDPSLLYDPSLNPKLKTNTGMAPPSSTTSSHPGDSFTGLASDHAQQNLVSSPGHPPSPGLSSPSLIADSAAHQSQLVPNSMSGYGNNPLSGRPAPQFRAPAGPSPQFAPPVGTVRIAVSTVGLSDTPFSTKHAPKPKQNPEPKQTPKPKQTSKPQKNPQSLKKPRSAGSDHSRHGRHLSSIPAEESNAPPTALGASESIVPDQSSFASSPQEWQSSMPLPGPSHPGSSGSIYSDYFARTQSVGKLNKETFNNGQAAGHVGPMDEATSWAATQHELSTGKTNPNLQNQIQGEHERALYQAQAESSSSSPLLSSQFRDSPEPANPNLISETSSAGMSDGIQARSMADLARYPAYQSHSRAEAQKSFSDISGSQEPAGQVSLSQSEDGSPVTAPSRPQQIRPRGDNVEQRSAMTPMVQAEGRNIQVSAMDRVGDVKEIGPVNAGTEFDFRKGAPYQRAFEASDTRGSRTAQQVEQDPHDSRSHESLANTAREPIGMHMVRVSSTDPPPNNAPIEYNAIAGPSGFINKADDSAESTRQAVRTYVGFGDPARSAPASSAPVSGALDNNVPANSAAANSVPTNTTTLGSGISTPDRHMVEAGEKEGYQAISSRSMISTSNEQLSENTGSPRFGIMESRPDSMRSVNYPTPGVHNGNGILDGLCIDNSTHCSCGMVEQTSDAPEECLFVVDENASPMVCVTRPCSGKVVCACAPGASTLCQRSVVRTILVRASTTSSEGTDDPTVVPCRRETLEDGILILTPII